MYTVNDFKMPEQHPFGMLRNYKLAFEKETVLAIILRQCVKQGKFAPVETAHRHPSMVKDGLLEETGDGKYQLTEKSIELLYSVYGEEKPDG